MKSVAEALFKSTNGVQGRLELRWHYRKILLVGRLFRNIADAGLYLGR
jgi:hypothetical protein